MRFLDFFTANNSNPNTCAAYALAVRGFFRWRAERGVRDLGAVRTHHVSAYAELLTRNYKAPTVKQRLAAIRMPFHWLIVGQVVSRNPAGGARVQPRGDQRQDAGARRRRNRRLLDGIDIGTVVGLRDRALIALPIRSRRLTECFNEQINRRWAQIGSWQASQTS